MTHPDAMHAYRVHFEIRDGADGPVTGIGSINVSAATDVEAARGATNWALEHDPRTRVAGAHVHVTRVTAYQD